MKGLALYEAFNDIPDAYIAEADTSEEAVSHAPRRVLSGVRRFLNSGWGVAALCAVIALGVVTAIVQAGLSGPGPDPAGSGAVDTVTSEPAESELSDEATGELETEGSGVPTEAPDAVTDPATDAPSADTQAPVPVWDGSVASSFGGGKGTASDPYMINTPAELAYFARRISSGPSSAGKYFALGSDLDMANIAWTPVGDIGHPFEGNFDGNGHTVSNLTVTAPSKYDSTNGETVATMGLFGAVANATVTDLTLSGMRIELGTGERYRYDRIHVGALAGLLEAEEGEDCTVSGCYVENVRMSIVQDSSMYVGLLIGTVNVRTNATLTASELQCVQEGSIRASCDGGTAYMGGLFGYMRVYGWAELEDICVYARLDPQNAATGYLGTVGAADVKDGRLTVSNAYASIVHYSDNAKAMALIGQVYNSAEHSAAFKLKNVFGYVAYQGQPETPEGPYGLYYSAIGTQSADNCAERVGIPAGHGFDEDIWDVSDPRRPRLKP